MIIWDRLFGTFQVIMMMMMIMILIMTFQAERNDVDIVYGLVDQPQFWNPLKHQVGWVEMLGGLRLELDNALYIFLFVQVYYYGKVWGKAMSMETWSDFLAAFWKGPGWFPGTQRLGDITFVAERPV